MMKIFLTLALEKNLLPEDLKKTIQALGAFADLQDPEKDAPLKPGQHEILESVHLPPGLGKLYFIALRLSRGARAIIALIRPEDPDQNTYCLALDVTETHDYQKHRPETPP